MKQPGLSESIILAHSDSRSYERGEQYFQSGMVEELTRRGDVLEAEVQGSDVDPYRVTATFGPSGEIEAHCTCPYMSVGWCKHIVAALLQYLHDPGSVEERPTLESLLAGLDRDQLVHLLCRVADRHSRLKEEIEAQVEWVRARRSSGSRGKTSQPAPAIDVRPIRQRVRAALRSLDRMSGSEAYYHVGGVVEEVREVLGEAEELLEEGNGRAALDVAVAVTEEYLKGYENLDDSDGDAGALFQDLGEVCAEAVLSTDLSPQERSRLGNQFEQWNDELEDYGIESFYPAVEAAQKGWDDPRIAGILRGESVEEPEDEEAWAGEELTRVRLRVLQRQGRLEECLRLARAEGETVWHATTLIKLGRTPEAVEYTLGSLENPRDALEIARALDEHGSAEEALRVGERGLTIPVRPGSYYQEPAPVTRYDSELALWLRDAAVRQNQTDLAVRAGQTAVREAPTLESYVRLQEISGSRWPGLREELLAGLQRAGRYASEGAVDILLHEGLIKEALDAVEGGWNYHLIGRVVDAAATALPERVIPICRQQAEEIMNAGRASHYDAAAHWLERAKRAYLAAGREPEWKEYLAQLMEQHARKYKLIPMLKRL